MDFCFPVWLLLTHLPPDLEEMSLKRPVPKALCGEVCEQDHQKLRSKLLGKNNVPSVALFDSSAMPPSC